jgi:hypothetical protein
MTPNLLWLYHKIELNKNLFEFICANDSMKLKLLLFDRKCDF